MVVIAIWNNNSHVHNQKLMAKIREMKPKMSELKLELRLDKPNDTKVVYFEELKELKFTESRDTLNISVERLGKLCLINHSVPFGGQCLKIFEKNKNVPHITVLGDWETNEISSKFINLIKASSVHKTLELNAEYPASQILELVLCCKTLTSINLCVAGKDGWC